MIVGTFSFSQFIDFVLCPETTETSDRKIFERPSHQSFVIAEPVFPPPGLSLG